MCWYAVKRTRQQKPAMLETCRWMRAVGCLETFGTRSSDDFYCLRGQLLYPVELRAVWDVAVDLG